MKLDIATRCVAASTGQDRIFVRVFDDVAIVALADGAGGKAGGDLAAQILVNEAAKMAQGVANPRDEIYWVRWLEQMDVVISEDRWAGETTAIVAAIGADFVVGASAGDSEAWLVGDDCWSELTGNQVRRPFLGSGGATPRAFSKKLTTETVLLASDGLIKYADAERVAQTARIPILEEAAAGLIELVRLPAGSFIDDVSCVLCRVSGNYLSSAKPRRAKKSHDWRNWF
ncbi:hypothetical protein EON80_23490 [bacterium]|nr:MAG: hypothetical protein EON80_23490 [bacterium]